MGGSFPALVLCLKSSTLGQHAGNLLALEYSHCSIKWDSQCKVRDFR